PLNWRMRDFYAGIGNKTIFTYGQQRHIETDWLDLIDAIDRGWSPLSWSPDNFLEAFPLPLQYNPIHQRFQGDRTTLVPNLVL
ncbi:MAG TPA: hypothetical protein V6C88_16475, partial [Chroococcidiopsis sp.]